MASDDEEVKDDVEESTLAKKPPAKSKPTISGISQQLDDLSYSLGLTFPSFGASAYRSGAQSGGTFGSSYQPKLSSVQRSNDNGSQAPRDLLTKKTTQEVIENELKDRNPKSNSSVKELAGLQTRLDKGGPIGVTEKRDFGIQTSDSLYSKTADAFLRMPADKRRVEFEVRSPARDGRNKSRGENPYDISNSQMKQFTKNVQDLYKRKQKAVYGEDEFKTAKRLE